MVRNYFPMWEAKRECHLCVYYTEITIRDANFFVNPSLVSPPPPPPPFHKHDKASKGYVHANVMGACFLPPR